MTESRAGRWWESKRLLAGVFEGGGAKGLAYAGALKAVRDSGCWFTAVAGASAGAITAAMVASGLTPEEIAELTPRALKELELRPVVRGLIRLRRTSGYLDPGGLRDLLIEVVESQYEKLTGSQWSSSKASFSGFLGGSETVTFLGLAEATGIELDVVAADLTDRQQIVFNAVNTPHCGVVDAVLASSAIPGFFENADLIVGDRIHTVVDGGVWSNFPMFVFSESYREFERRQWAEPLKKALLSSLKPSSLPDDATTERLVDSLLARTKPKSRDLVVGFILREEKAPPTEIQNIRFARGGLFSPAQPAEWLEPADRRSAAADRREHGASRRLLGWIVTPLSWILFLYLRAVPSLASERSRGGAITREFRGRWPEPSSPVAGWIARWLDDIAGSLYRITFVVLAWLALAACMALGMQRLWQLIEPLRVEAPDYIARLTVSLAELAWFIGALIVATVAILGLVAFTAGSFGIRAVRRVGYGLVRTYVAGTGAPAWSGYAGREHVIRLPVGDITTLSFDVPEPQQIAVQENAYTKTKMELERILSAQRS